MTVDSVSVFKVKVAILAMWHVAVASGCTARCRALPHLLAIILEKFSILRPCCYSKNYSSIIIACLPAIIPLVHMVSRIEPT